MKPILLTVLLTLISSAVALAQVPLPVQDNAVRLQIEREVFHRWNKFNPEWWFILFHNKYRKGEDRRNQIQLIKMMGALKLSENQSEQEHEHADTISVYEQAYLANVLAETHYHLYWKDVFEEFNTRFLKDMMACQQAGMPERDRQAFYTERRMLNEVLDILRKGSLSPGDQNEGMQHLQAEWASFLSGLNKARKMYATHQKFSEIPHPLKKY